MQGAIDSGGGNLGYQWCAIVLCNWLGLSSGLALCWLGQDIVARLPGCLVACVAWFLASATDGPSNILKSAARESIVTKLRCGWV